MPLYDVIGRCVHCGDQHPLLTGIYLVRGPDGPESVADAFRDEPLPPQVLALKGRAAFCLKSGKKYQLSEAERIILKPV